MIRRPMPSTTWFPNEVRIFSRSVLARAAAMLLLSSTPLLACATNWSNEEGQHSEGPQSGTPAQQGRVVVISLDGGARWLLEHFLKDGTIPPDRGLGLLAKHGVVARGTETVTPSLTAVGHISIASGARPPRTDIVANFFHLVDSPFATGISGFAAPIGGPRDRADADQHGGDGGHGGHGADGHHGADPLWIAARAAGRKVVTATWPGSDGAVILRPGAAAGSAPIDSVERRTVDYTVPFGAFGGQGARGFALKPSDFQDGDDALAASIRATGRSVVGKVRVLAKPLEQFKLGGVDYSLGLAVFDASDDGRAQFDQAVVYDQKRGIEAGPFALPETGPAWMKGERSAPFYFSGSANRAVTAFIITQWPQASSDSAGELHLTRMSANGIPRNAAVLREVDDINTQVGAWAPQPDYRIVERLSPGFEKFSDRELEAVHEDQVRTFTDYQTRVARHAIRSLPDADLSMFYFEQPDGTEHQYLMIDDRQPSNPLDASSILGGQDKAKKERYAAHVRHAWQAANDGVQKILETVGFDAQGRPLANVFVVADHGFLPFHTTVDLSGWMVAQGFDPKKLRAVTSGPSVNFYVNRMGREPDGIVGDDEAAQIIAKLGEALRALKDGNANYRNPVSQQAKTFGPGHQGGKPADQPIFESVVEPKAGERGHHYGADAGDVVAMLAPGYNFDGLQTPVVHRMGDAKETKPLLSVPNFYGAHGYDARHPAMDPLFVAAGPQVCAGDRKLKLRNIDVAPTALRIMGVKVPATMEGKAVDLCSK